MAFWKDLTKSMGGAFISGAKNGIAQGIIENSQIRINKPLTPEEIVHVLDSYNSENTAEIISFSNAITTKTTSIIDVNDNNFPNFLSEQRKKLKQASETKVENTEDLSMVRFKAPDWNYEDFINERIMWQRGITSIAGEQSWFYFKIFFHFDTQQGLFGGILNDKDIAHAQNSAGKFLWLSNNLSKSLYSKLNLPHRLVALQKFTSILSYITSETPWVFKTIKGMQNVNTILKKDYTKEQFIEIGLAPESIDMRLNTMFDLYKYVVWDNINFKEIIPENLRKFDMTILVFNAPIKKLNTAIQSKKHGYFDYKHMYNATNQFENIMSYKMFSFKNCEFNMESLANIFPNDLSNETPFQMGNSSIKINYDRVYVHNSNEFLGLFFGDDQIYYSQYGKNIVEKFLPDNGKQFPYIINPSTNYIQAKRYEALQNALFNFSFTPNNKKNYKELISASEDLSNVLLHNKLDAVGEIGTNFLLSALKVNLSSQGIMGNLYGDYAPGSQYFKDKIKNLRNGSRDLSMEAFFLKNKDDFDNLSFKDKLKAAANNRIRNKIRYS